MSSGSLFDRFRGGKRVEPDRDAEYELRLNRPEALPKGEGARRRTPSKGEKTLAGMPWRKAMAVPVSKLPKPTKTKSQEKAAARRQFRSLAHAPRTAFREFAELPVGERRERELEFAVRIRKGYAHARSQAPARATRFNSDEKQTMRDLDRLMKG